MFQIIDRTRQGSKMKHAIDRTLDFDRFSNIMLDEHKVRIPEQMFNILQAARDEIIQSNDGMPLFNKTIRQV